jgi:hypothetical protein
MLLGGHATSASSAASTQADLKPADGASFAHACG